MAEESELWTRSSARLGTTLRGKYRLDRVLGIGGMAVVYAATHRNLKRFAVKVLHAELSIRDDIRSRFLREGYAANSLEHPGAVAVLDEDVAEDGSAFLVMELLEGSGVEEMWERLGQRVPVGASMAIGYQLLDVLAAAHEKGIVHRDIKPANLFLTGDGILKVLDFGIARVRDAVATGSKSTGTGMLLGTPAFMAPEQALAISSEIDGQTDLWAAGATLFTLLSGELVHQGDNAPQLMVRAATTHARSLASVAPNLPPGVVHIVDRAIAFDKAARWSRAEEMRDAIRDAYREIHGEPISRASIVSLFQGPKQTLPATQRAPLPAGPPPMADRATLDIPQPTSALARSPAAHTIDAPPAGTLRAGTTALGAASTIGTSTSTPVSSDAPRPPAGVPRGKRRTPAWVVASVGVIAAVAVTTLAFHGRSPAAQAVDSTTSSSRATATSGTAASPLPENEATPAPPSVQPVTPAIDAALPRVPPAPTPNPSRHPPAKAQKSNPLDLEFQR